LLDLHPIKTGPKRRHRALSFFDASIPLPLPLPRVSLKAPLWLQKCLLSRYVRRLLHEEFSFTCVTFFCSCSYA
jgi:hypothetical protein